MILIVLFKFLDAKPILQCLWLSSFLPSWSFTVLETLSVMLFSYCHQLLSYVFSLNNSSVQQQTRMINVPWDVACYPRPLYSCLVVLPTFASARLSLLDFSVFSVFASVRLSLYFASSGHFVMLSVGWLYSLVVCVAPGVFLKTVYTGYHGYACSWS